MALTKKWDEYMAGRLRDHPEEIPDYLNVCLEEGDGTILEALRHVIDAKIGISGLSRETDLHRVSLQKFLSERENPRLSNFEKVLDVIGLRMAVVPKGKKQWKGKAKAG